MTQKPGKPRLADYVGHMLDAVQFKRGVREMIRRA